MKQYEEKSLEAPSICNKILPFFLLLQLNFIFSSPLSIHSFTPVYKHTVTSPLKNQPKKPFLHPHLPPATTHFSAPFLEVSSLKGLSMHAIHTSFFFYYILNPVQMDFKIQRSLRLFHTTKSNGCFLAFMFFVSSILRIIHSLLLEIQGNTSSWFPPFFTGYLFSVIFWYLLLSLNA